MVRKVLLAHKGNLELTQQSLDRKVLEDSQDLKDLKVILGRKGILVQRDPLVLKDQKVTRETLGL